MHNIASAKDYLRWWRVLRSSLRCFFLLIRLRRFLMTEPISASVHVVHDANLPKCTTKHGRMRQIDKNFSKYFSPRAHRVFHRGTIHKHRQPPLTHSKDSAREKPQTPGNAPSGTQCDSRHSHITGNPARKQPQTPENAPANRLCDSRHSHIAAPAQPRQSKTQQPQRPSHTTTTPDRQCDSNHSHIARIQPENSPKPPKMPPQTANVTASAHT